MSLSARRYAGESLPVRKIAPFGWYQSMNCAILLTTAFQVMLPSIGPAALCQCQRLGKIYNAALSHIILVRAFDGKNRALSFHDVRSQRGGNSSLIIPTS